VAVNLQSKVVAVALSRRPPVRPWRPRVDRGAAGVRDTPYDRALSAPRSRPARAGGPRRRAARQRARDERPMTYFRAAASSPPRIFGGDQLGGHAWHFYVSGGESGVSMSGKARLIPHGRGRDGPRNGGTVSDKPHEKPSRP